MSPFGTSQHTWMKPGASTMLPAPSARISPDLGIDRHRPPPLAYLVSPAKPPNPLSRNDTPRVPDDTISQF